MLIIIFVVVLSFCYLSVIVKASSGPRYVVGCRSKVDKEKLTAGTRVVLDMTTLTIMRALPREVRFCGLFLFGYLFDMVDVEFLCPLGYLVWFPSENHMLILCASWSI